MEFFASAMDGISVCNTDKTHTQIRRKCDTKIHKENAVQHNQTKRFAPRKSDKRKIILT